MSQFDPILLAVDKSAPSDRAVLAARDLATLSGGTVHVLHVREVDVATGGKVPGTYERESDEDVESLLGKELAALREKDVKVTVDVRWARDAEAARAIVDVAEEIGAGVVVMGSRGQSPLAALVVGSTAYKVLHAARRPVMIVP